MKKLHKAALLIVAAVSLIIGLTGLVTVKAATSVSLGAADNFAILAGTAITETGTTIITGDVGLSPTGGAAITGLTSGEVAGTIYAVDAAGPAGSVSSSTLLTAAKNALVTAYNTAAGQVPVSTVASQLGGTTKTAGIYNSTDGELAISGTLTLDAEGDPNAVFIFKAASTLITAASSNVVLVNGAQACNVFWQVGSSATLATGSTFKGNILASESVTLTTGANVEGRILASNGAVTLQSNTITKATCVTPPPTPVPPSTSTSGGFALIPLINITKVPSPLALPSGSGSVTYTYSVTNIGPIAMRGIWVTDNKCSAVNFVSGDSNNDSQLDLNETWTYRCVKTVTQTETNTAMAHGSANGWDAYDTANATVAVGASLPPPLIHLVKKPSVSFLLAPGGPVTYSYTVTNPGTAPLSNVSVTDDKCTSLPGRVTGHPGDLNKNDLLESNEAWSFTCQTNLTKTTTNTGTAEGSANGLTAVDFALATVVVGSPGLPNTGLPLGETSIPWMLVVSVGILVAAGTFVGLVLRKKTS